jgi:uncharacterized protein (DUF488 family)
VPEALTIYTWGYSTNRTFEDLLAALPEDRRESGRVAIIDVRRSRRSRNPQWHCPHYSHWEHYSWLMYLGNAEGAARGTWQPALGPKRMQEHLDYATSLLRRYGAVVLICAERDPRRCHRVQVAEALAARTGAEIVHL